MDTLVSIQCLTYNHEKYIIDAIESLLMQKTNFAYEILIGDDCSTDNTRKIVEEYVKKYPDKIRLITSKKNMGARINARRLQENSQGKYVAVCEGDDYWTDPFKLQKQINYMEKHPDCSICFHAAEIVHPSKKPTGRVVRPDTKDRMYNVEEIIEGGGGFFATASIVYVKRLMNNAPDFYLNAPVGDYPLSIFLAYQGYGFYIDENMAAHRKGVPGSWSRKRMQGEKSRSLKIKHRNSILQMLDQFNEYSDFKHSKAVERKKTSLEFKKLILEKKSQEMKTLKYKKYYDALGIKGKIKIYAQWYIPGVYHRSYLIIIRIKQLLKI